VRLPKPGEEAGECGAIELEDALSVLVTAGLSNRCSPFIPFAPR
jgi:hypothetical protein